jgi:hypothetical protein
MTAINPALLPNACNIAQNSESYLITYYKLNHLLKNNTSVTRIILGFSYPNFSGYMDSLYYDDIATNDLFSRIYPIVAPSDLLPLKVDLKKYYTVWLKNYLLYPKWNHLTYLGGFTELKYGLNKANLQSVIKRHYYYRSGQPAQISIINKNYLYKIIQLTQQRNIQLVLVNIPLHPKYLKEIPPRFIQFYNQLKQEFLQKGIIVLDYSSLVLNDAYFKDYNHLCLEGANYFTTILKNDLKNTFN